MEEHQYAVGDRVEKLCVPCGEERWHVVASLNIDTVGPASVPGRFFINSIPLRAIIEAEHSLLRESQCRRV
jgi:hypothetical protein